MKRSAIRGWTGLESRKPRIALRFIRATPKIPLGAPLVGAPAPGGYWLQLMLAVFAWPGS